jgi:hypothetical protein
MRATEMGFWNNELSWLGYFTSGGFTIIMIMPIKHVYSIVRVKSAHFVKKHCKFHGTVGRVLQCNTFLTPDTCSKNKTKINIYRSCWFKELPPPPNSNKKSKLCNFAQFKNKITSMAFYF